MKTLLLATLLLLAMATPALAAPTIIWDTVVTDTTGSPLPIGQEVKSYTVYRCPVNVTPCVKASATIVGTVLAASPITPRQSLDLAGQQFPAVFMVTASNIIAESAESPSIKATPSASPKNTIVQ